MEDSIQRLTWTNASPLKINYMEKKDYDVKIEKVPEGRDVYISGKFSKGSLLSPFVPSICPKAIPLFFRRTCSSSSSSAGSSPGQYTRIRAT